jgi:hypothetical protein
MNSVSSRSCANAAGSSHSFANQPPALLKCTGCQKVFYCNVTCQKQHWKATHKAECAKVDLKKGFQSAGTLDDFLGTFGKFETEIVNDWNAISARVKASDLSYEPLVDRLIEKLNQQITLIKTHLTAVRRLKRRFVMGSALKNTVSPELCVESKKFLEERLKSRIEFLEIVQKLKGADLVDQVQRMGAEELD